MRDLTVNEIEVVNGGGVILYNDVWPLPWMRPELLNSPMYGTSGGYSHYAKYYRNRYSYGNTDFNNGYGYA